jgi:hypothetical protein
MRKTSRSALSLLIAAASIGISVAVAAPASACTGDPCDGFCLTYSQLPPSVQQKVFHSSSCPIR